MVKIVVDKNDYITSIGNTSSSSHSINWTDVFPDSIVKTPITIDNMFDDYGNLAWKLVKGDSGDSREYTSIEYIPQTPTEEQKKRKEDREIAEKIRITTNINDELKLLWESIEAGSLTQEATSFRQKVAQIKEEVRGN